MLFATYLKAGFVHILAFLGDGSGRLAEMHVVDTMAIALLVETREDLLDRLRLAMALFTVQGHVIRLLKNMYGTCLDASLKDTVES